jgi:hypothetical protein
MKKRDMRKRSGQSLNQFRPVFEYCIPYFVPISFLSENTNSIGINVEIGAERNGIYPVRFQP